MRLKLAMATAVVVVSTVSSLQAGGLLDAQSEDVVAPIVVTEDAPGSMRGSLPIVAGGLLLLGIAVGAGGGSS